ncbi:MAG: addiction module protein [Gammaproteobacteria bacterium]|nr:addiction module protein [Gammaproteobacteria bacterium]
MSGWWGVSYTSASQSNLLTQGGTQTGNITANTLPLEKMSVEEKLLAMESLWDDLGGKAGVMPSPAWHEGVLTERDAMQQRGDDAFEDWKVAKRNIRNKIS